MCKTLVIALANDTIKLNLMLHYDAKRGGITI